MNVLLISECRKKAWKSTRRIVSQYLSQHGSRVWMGSIDSEGLLELHKELRRKATKNNAIICFVITSRLTKTIAFRVGSQKMFDDQGHYAFSQTRNLMPRETEEWPLIAYLSLVVTAAGLLHDVGKAMRSFQDKLKNGRKTDPIRHDLYSALLFLHFVKKSNKISKGTSIGEKETAALKMLSDPAILNGEQLHQFFCEKASRQGKGKFKELKNAFEDCAYGKTVSLLAFLIAGHHIQPDINKARGMNLPSLKLTRFFHEAEWDERPKEKLSFDKSYDLPWLNPRWVERLRDTFMRLLELQFPEVPFETLVIYAYLIARPALVAADQTVSADGTKQAYPGNPKNLLFANTTDKGQLAQLLIGHLMKVSHKAGRNIRAIRHIWEGTLVDGIQRLPRTLKKNPELKRFRWQKNIQETAEKIAKAFKPGDGFFGVMIAETGSGKTRAIPRFMGNLQQKGDIRFTLALGLRTLTRQSGIAYQKEMAFEKEKVAVLIGGEFQDDVYSEAEDKLQGDAEETLSEAETDIGQLLSQDFDFDSLFPKQLAGPLDKAGERRWTQKNRNLARMLQAPILICTIDHLMAGLVSARASDAKRLNRIVSHDLVIDEIDSFDTKDLLALARLVFLSGCAGRKILISSATLPPVVAELLYRCYLSGFTKFREICPGTGKPNIFTAWMTHEPSINHYQKKRWQQNPEEQIQEFQDEYRNTIEKLIEKLDSRPIKHKVEFLNLDFDPNQSHPKEEILKSLSIALSHKIDKLHESFKVHNGTKSVSIGLIRFSNTFDAMEIFNVLLTEKAAKGTKRLFVFYQSNLANHILNHVEETLNSLLDRKHGPNQIDPIFSHPLLLEIFQRYQTYDDFQIIVVATPIEEVGRDHDFDWAILEPASNWSAIQTAGRVRRHREKYLSEGDPANIVLLPYTCKTLFKKKRISPYACPGPVNGNHKLKHKHAPAAKLFDQDMKIRLDSRYAMVTPEYDHQQVKNGNTYEYQYLSHIEHGCIYFEMEDLIKRIISPFSCFTTYYERFYPFRDAGGSVNIRFSLDENGIKLERLKLGRKIFKEKNIDEFVKDFGFTDAKNCGDILLLNYDREYDSDTLMCHAYIDENVQVFAHHRDSLRLYYNDVLGGCVRK